MKSVQWVAYKQSVVGRTCGIGEYWGCSGRVVWCCARFCAADCMILLFSLPVNVAVPNDFLYIWAAAVQLLLHTASFVGLICHLQHSVFCHTASVWHEISFVCHLYSGFSIQEKWKTVEQRMEEEICNIDGWWSSHLLPKLQCKRCSFVIVLLTTAKHTRI